MGSRSNERTLLVAHPFAEPRGVDLDRERRWCELVRPLAESAKNGAATAARIAVARSYFALTKGWTERSWPTWHWMQKWVRFG